MATNTDLHKTSVEGDIICEVARSRGMGAGSVKAACEHPDMVEEGSRRDEAMKECYRRQAERDGLEPTV